MTRSEEDHSQKTEWPVYGLGLSSSSISGNLMDWCYCILILARSFRVKGAFERVGLAETWSDTANSEKGYLEHALWFDALSEQDITIV